MPVVDIIPEADFDRDGTYETDLSAYFADLAGGLSIGRGAARGGTPGQGQLSLNLHNNSGTFTPDYASSSLYGQLEPKVPIRIRCTFASTDYTLFTGYVSRYRPKFGRVGALQTSIEAQDLMAHLEGYPTANVTLDARTTDEALEAIATAVGLTSVDIDLDAGVEALDYHWCRNANALTAMFDVVRSEMGGELFINADGVIRFLARNARLGVSAPTHTWGNGTSIVPESIEVEWTDEDLISQASVQPSILVEDIPDVIIFALESPIPVTADVPVTLEFDFPMPVDALDTTPTATEDYLQNDAADGTGSDQTSALTVTITDLGAGFRVVLLSTLTGYVTLLNLHALPLNPATSRPVFSHALPITGEKMPQGVTLAVPYGKDSQATRDYPVPLCRTYRYVYPFVKLEFAWDSDAIAAAMLSAEMWDQVYFDDTGPGQAAWLTNLKDWFYIVGLNHSLQAGGVFRTTVTLVPSYLYFDLDHVVYDSFDRADGALGIADSADTWGGGSGFAVVSNAATPITTDQQTPTLLVA